MNQNRRSRQTGMTGHDRPEYPLTNVLEIFRVFYNYCKVGDDKQTPAMRLGLAKAPIALEDVLYFEGDSGIARANKKVVPITGTTFNQAPL